MFSLITVADAISLTPLGTCLARRCDAGAVFRSIYPLTAARAATTADHTV